MAFRFSAGDDADLPINHDINVTPFIDVMLVLLIIFMVAAPLATVDVKVDLPVAAAQAAPRPDKPVTVSIRADGTMLVDDRAVRPDAVGAMVRDLAGPPGAEGPRIYLRADRKVAYEHVMTAMNGLRAAGYLQVAMVGVEAGAAR